MAHEPRLAVESIAGQRPYQEDSVLARSLSDGRLLVAVADGMGGHAAGEVASALALETLVSALEGGEALDAAVVSANAAVHQQARDPDKKGMGTTLTAVLVDDGEYFVANVGDSRGYLLTGDGIRQMTEDHSFVAEAMKRGQSREEAMATPWRDALTRSIGTEPQVDVDVFGPFPVKDDSALLICSDGLYKTLSDEDLRRIFLQSGSPDTVARTLVSEALERGSDDNISVAIAEFGEVPRGSAQATVPLSYAPDPDDDPGAVTGPAGERAAAPTPSSRAVTEPVLPAVDGAAAPPAGDTASTEAAAVPPVGVIVAVVAVVVVLVALLTL